MLNKLLDSQCKHHPARHNKEKKKKGKTKTKIKCLLNENEGIEMQNLAKMIENEKDGEVKK